MTSFSLTAAIASFKNIAPRESSKVGSSLRNFDKKASAAIASLNI